MTAPDHYYPDEWDAPEIDDDWIDAHTDSDGYAIVHGDAEYFDDGLDDDG
jgi:hypothetical protein